MVGTVMNVKEPPYYMNTDSFEIFADSFNDIRGKYRGAAAIVGLERGFERAGRFCVSLHVSVRENVESGCGAVVCGQRDSEVCPFPVVQRGRHHLPRFTPFESGRIDACAQSREG